MEEIKLKDWIIDGEDLEDLEFSNYFGPGNTLEGKLDFNGRIILDESFVNGKIKSSGKEGEVYVSPGTEIIGDVKSKGVVLGGTMEGKIEAKKVKVLDGASFSGQITTNKGLTVESGAKLSARIKMPKNKGKHST